MGSKVGKFRGGSWWHLQEGYRYPRPPQSVEICSLSLLARSWQVEFPSRMNVPGGHAVQSSVSNIIQSYLYGPARRPAIVPMLSPPPATTPTGAASHLPPSVKISYAHMLYLRAGFVPPMHYKTGYLHAVFTTAYNMPIQSIYNVLLPIKYLYSRHILATIKISCAIHTCWPRTTYTLPTWYLYNTPPIPQGGRG